MLSRRNKIGIGMIKRLVKGLPYMKLIEFETGVRAQMDQSNEYDQKVLQIVEEEIQKRHVS